jgi:hypothetical protein
LFDGIGIARDQHTLQARPDLAEPVYTGSSYSARMRNGPRIPALDIDYPYTPWGPARTGAADVLQCPARRFWNLPASDRKFAAETCEGAEAMPYPAYPH